MKKLTAMLLALCMLLAAVSALGEGASGNWYMTLADVTLGYILLNEDGTAVVNVASQEDITGTWTENGDVVTVTAQNQPLDLAFDGSSLKADMFPLALTREEGKLPMDVISKMMSGETYELPEGMTEMDVMAIAVNFVTEYTKLMEGAGESGASDGADSTGAEPAAEPVKAEVTVLQENFYVYEAYSGFEAMYIAKVQNNTDVPLFLTGGSMTVKDEEENVVAEEKYLATCASRYLEPGEISFVSFRGDMAKNVPVTYETVITVETDSYRDTDTAVKAENPEYRKDPKNYGTDYVAVTVTNETDQPLPGIEAVLVPEDAEGNLLGISCESLYEFELCPGSSITLVSSVPKKVTDYCAANGIEPAVVESCAWVENRGY